MFASTLVALAFVLMLLVAIMSVLVLVVVLLLSCNCCSRCFGTMGTCACVPLLASPPPWAFPSFAPRPFVRASASAPSYVSQLQRSTFLIPKEDRFTAALKSKKFVKHMQKPHWENGIQKPRSTLKIGDTPLGTPERQKMLMPFAGIMEKSMASVSLKLDSINTL